MNKQQERLVQRTMDTQRELTRSGLDRRNLLKLGVLSASTGMPVTRPPDMVNGSRTLCRRAAWLLRSPGCARCTMRRSAS